MSSPAQARAAIVEQPLARAVATARREFRADPLAFVGALVCVIVVAVAVLGPAVAPHDPLDTTAGTFADPSLRHPFGTDDFGRDIFSRVLHALRLDLFIAIVAVTGALVIGTSVGSISGYVGGRFDDISMRVIDVVMSFPMFILALGLVAFLGVGMKNLIIVTVVINIPIFARLVRGDILAKAQAEYIAAARCSGCTGTRILVRHLLPNAMGPLIVQSSLNLGWAMLNTAALSFLGVGIKPPTPELGVMVADGAQYLSEGAWWMSFFPGLCLGVIVFAFNLLGDGLQDRLDPRREAI